MNKKVFFLLLALIVPVLVFIFLKFFGKNEFSVEPLYQSQESKLPAGCAGIKWPYAIADSSFHFLKEGHEVDTLLVLFCESKAIDLEASEKQLTRLQEAFQFGSGLGLRRIVRLNESLECVLILQPKIDLVLIDSHKRIRGQYSSNDRDEVDRLMTELDIILKRY